MPFPITFDLFAWARAVGIEHAADRPWYLVSAPPSTWRRAANPHAR